MPPDTWIPKKYLVKSEVCAVEACCQESGISYYYTHLKNNNNKLQLLACGTFENVLQVPEAIIKNKVPVLLIINGKGVIIKKISLSETEDEDAEALIRTHLPALNRAEFYVQVYRQQNHTAFISLCRKEQVNEQLAGLPVKTDLAAIHLGAAVITGLKPLWSGFNNLHTSLHVAELNNNALYTLTADTRADKTTVEIEDLRIEAQHSLGFSAGLAYLLQNKLHENGEAALAQIETAHLEKNKIRFLTISVVILAFVLAIGNVCFYTTYFDANNKLDAGLQLYQGKYEQINTLLGDYQKNKSMIESAGMLAKNRLSEYGDLIAGTVPDEIVLSELYFNPAKESDNSTDSLPAFDNGQLIVKGRCAKSFVVNEWINVLKMQKFIRYVNLQKFSYNNEALQLQGLPNFEIRLTTE